MESQSLHLVAPARVNFPCLGLVKKRVSGQKGGHLKSMQKKVGCPDEGGGSALAGSSVRGRLCLILQGRRAGKSPEEKLRGIYSIFRVPSRPGRTAAVIGAYNVPSRKQKGAAGLEKGGKGGLRGEVSPSKKGVIINIGRVHHTTRAHRHTSRGSFRSRDERVTGRPR